MYLETRDEGFFKELNILSELGGNGLNDYVFEGFPLQAIGFGNVVNGTVDLT